MKPKLKNNRSVAVVQSEGETRLECSSSIASFLLHKTDSLGTAVLGRGVLEGLLQDTVTLVPHSRLWQELESFPGMP